MSPFPLKKKQYKGTWRSGLRFQFWSSSSSATKKRRELAEKKQLIHTCRQLQTTLYKLLQMLSWKPTASEQMKTASGQPMQAASNGVLKTNSFGTNEDSFRPLYTSCFRCCLENQQLWNKWRQLKATLYKLLQMRSWKLTASEQMKTASGKPMQAASNAVVWNNGLKANEDSFSQRMQIASNAVLKTNSFTTNAFDEPI